MMGYWGRFAGVLARGLIDRRGSMVPASLAYSRRSCGSRVPAVVSQAYRRGACC